MAEPGIKGLWHLALRVTDLGRSRQFYEGFFGFRVVWQPDPGNLYLSSGADNLALHQMSESESAQSRAANLQFLDHLGMIVDAPETVDRLFRQAEHAGVRVVLPPKRHRDGSYSCYLADPDGNTVQVLFEPTISKLDVIDRAANPATGGL